MSVKINLGFCGLLTITFITLRLCNVIDWNWFWILSPLWIPITFYIFLILFIFLSGYVASVLISFGRNGR